jgi:hypothetical protein
VLHGAPGSIVHRQLHAFASEVLEYLDSLPAVELEPEREPLSAASSSGRLAPWVLSRG